MPEVEWLIAGDFNNIVNPRDKQGGSTKTNTNTRELKAWSKPLTRLGVYDALYLGAFFRKTTKVFTWMNVRNNKTMNLSRIDRIYVPTHVENIWGTTDVFDICQIFSRLCHISPTMQVFCSTLMTNERGKYGRYALTRGS